MIEELEESAHEVSAARLSIAGADAVGLQEERKSLKAHY